MIVGDSTGFVHLLSREDGSPLNRLTHRRLGHRRARRCVAGNTLVVVTRNGGVLRLRARVTGSKGRLRMKPVMALVGPPQRRQVDAVQPPDASRATPSSPTSPASRATATTATRRQGRHEFIVIDTGGFEPDAGSGIFKEMAKQTRQAVAEADVVVFVVDARDGLSAQDHDIANVPAPAGQAPRAGGQQGRGHARTAPQLAEFYELGLGEVHAVSAAHGQGIRSLVEAALAPLTCPSRTTRSRGERQPAGRSSWRSPAGPTSASRR